MTRLFTILAATVAVLALGGSATAGPILDDYTVPLSGVDVSGTSLTANTGTPSVMSGSNATGVGITASRLITVTRTAGGGTSTLQLDGFGQVQMDTNNATNTAATISLAYTIPQTNLSSSTGLEFDIDSVATGFSALDNPSVQVFITDASSLTQSTALVAILTNGTLFVPFGSIDRNEVTNVTIEFKLNQNEDVILSNAGLIGGLGLRLEVPEPATLAVLGLFGLAGVIRGRRRTNLAA